MLCGSGFLQNLSLFSSQVTTTQGQNMADTSSASTTNSDQCASCNKKAGTGATLKRCAKCQTTQYCSRDCQKTHWKEHKKVCARQAAAVASASESTSGPSSASASASGGASGSARGLTVTIEKPFHRLNDRTWIHDRPEEDTYKLLIDTYRLRMDDDFKFEGKCNAGSVYANASNGIEAFRRFLRLAESRDGLLPPWWSSEKATQCEEMGNVSGWSSLSQKADKAQILGHYGDSNMPMQMRLFGEQVYGTAPGGQPGAPIIAMQMRAEVGAMHSSTIDASKMFGSR